MPPRLLATIVVTALVTLGAVHLRTATAAPPTAMFAPGPTSLINDRGQAWHKNYEAVGDYNESWFVLVHTRASGLLLATVFITNLGLHTYDAGYDVTYYDAEGHKTSCHREYGRDDIRASETGLDLRVGRAHLWKDDGVFRLLVDEPELTIDLTLTPELPPHQFGDGRLQLADGKMLALALNAPRATTSGTMHAGALTAQLEGDGSHEHLLATVKLPSLLQRWQTLRLYSPTMTLVLFEQQLTPRYGGGLVQTGLLGRRGEILASLRSFALRPVQSRREPVSGYEYPTELAIEARGGGYEVRGTVCESRFLEAVDVLAAVSWPVRTAIRIFYSKPYSLRYLGHYELDVVDPGGATTHLTGEAPLETNFYD